MGEKWVKWVKWVKLSWDTHGHRARQRELGCRTRLPDTTAGHDRRTRLPDTEQYLLRLVLARAARADVHDLLGGHGRSETPGRSARGARADVHDLLGEHEPSETPGLANSPGCARGARVVARGALTRRCARGAVHDLPGEPCTSVRKLQDLRTVLGCTRRSGARAAHAPTCTPSSVSTGVWKLQDLRTVLGRGARADVHDSRSVHDLFAEHGPPETPGLANSPGMHAAHANDLLGEHGRSKTPGLANTKSPGMHAAHAPTCTTSSVSAGARKLQDFRKVLGAPAPHAPTCTTSPLSAGARKLQDLRKSWECPRRTRRRARPPR